MSNDWPKWSNAYLYLFLSYFSTILFYVYIWNCFSTKYVTLYPLLFATLLHSLLLHIFLEYLLIGTQLESYQRHYYWMIYFSVVRGWALVVKESKMQSSELLLRLLSKSSSWSSNHLIPGWLLICLIWDLAGKSCTNLYSFLLENLISDIFVGSK